eukprot:gene7663-9127_t
MYEYTVLLLAMSCLYDFIQSSNSTLHLIVEDKYHNFEHAADVAHTVYQLISTCFHDLSTHERLALMVAALAHDIQHPGQTNAFLIKTKDPLAVAYNDLSVLESMHAATLFRLLLDHPESDVLRNLEDSEWLASRKMVISMVLSTDMSKHFEMVSQLDKLVEERQSVGGGQSVGGEGEGAAGELERRRLLDLILHAADISNPCKPFEIAQQWVDRVFEEFFAQGDLERSKGLSVSPNMERASTSKAQAQVSFIEGVVAPLWANVAILFPETCELFEKLVANRLHWMELCKEEVFANLEKSDEQKREEVVDIDSRMHLFLEKYGGIAKNS